MNLHQLLKIGVSSATFIASSAHVIDPALRVDDDVQERQPAAETLRSETTASSSGNIVVRPGAARLRVTGHAPTVIVSASTHA
jgi:hypothetical protein